MVHWEALSRPERLTRALVLAVTLGIGAAYVIVRAGEFEPADAAAYWDAALRLRSGESPYLLLPDPDAAEVFRYAPWFAAAWILLTYLPPDLVFTGWWVAMLAVAAYICWRVARLGAAGIAVVGLLGPYLIWIAGRGNVHPLVLLPLLLGVESRAGPLLIGAAASLKATPLAFALVYLGRRQYRRFILALFAFTVLTAPIVLFDASAYQLDPGRDPNPIFAISPLLWVATVAVLSVTTLYVARRWPEHAWWVASLAAMAAVLRFLPYSVTYLLVGLAPAIAMAADRGSGRGAALARAASDKGKTSQEDRKAVGP